MKLYRTVRGVVLEEAGSFFSMPDAWDALINRDDLIAASGCRRNRAG